MESVSFISCSQHGQAGTIGKGFGGGERGWGASGGQARVGWGKDGMCAGGQRKQPGAVRCGPPRG